MHQLNPELNKNKWSLEDNKLLFNLHKTYKSHWKRIAEHFVGRTDNSIKNQFFSMVRKALRKACKILGNVSNTNTINKIKPKVLSNYLSLDYDIPLKGKGQNSVKVCFNEFVQQFAFTKYHELVKNLTDDDLTMIGGCIDYLNNLNEGYVKKKKKISKKPAKRSMSDSFKRVQSDNNEHTPLKPVSPPKDPNAMVKFPDIIRPLMGPKKVVTEESGTTEDVVKKFEDLFNSTNKLELSQENAKDKLANFFSNLGELSYKVKNMLLNSSDSGKDSLMLSNFFSVASKTRKFFEFDENEIDDKDRDRNPLFNSNDDEHMKKLANIFTVPEPTITHQTNVPNKNDIQFHNEPTNRHLEQFNHFFQNEYKNDENQGAFPVGSVDYGISERIANSKKNSFIDNQSHVEAVFTEHGLPSLNNSKLFNEPVYSSMRATGRFFRSKTQNYTDTKFEQFADI